MALTEMNENDQLYSVCAGASEAHCWQDTEKLHFQGTNHAWISASPW